MTTLNRAAALALESLPPDAVHACTDITGFGLIGHASEMAAASGCTIEIDSRSVPFLEGARDLVTENSPGGARTNREHFGPDVHVSANVDTVLLDLLYDPQTSGGLLIAVANPQERVVTSALSAAGVSSARIGTVIVSERSRIVVR
jgi:selenide,water dikinase